MQDGEREGGKKGGTFLLPGLGVTSPMPLLWLVLLAGVAGNNNETSAGIVLSSSGTPTFIHKSFTFKNLVIFITV